ncbi:MAG: hypothetical protein ACRER2_08695 [Methylococcales bacterium]
MKTVGSKSASIHSGGAPPGAIQKEGSGYLIRDDAVYGKRFQNFAHFYNERMHQVYPLEPIEQSLSVLSERDSIQFLGLNSAWEIDEYFKDRSSINPGARARALEKADQQAVRDGDLSADKSLLRIVVWHHPPTGNDKIYTVYAKEYPILPSRI